MSTEKTALETNTDRKGFCPTCGSKGRAVKPVTVESLVVEAARARVGRTDGFRFCADPSCGLVSSHRSSPCRHFSVIWSGMGEVPVLATSTSISSA